MSSITNLARAYEEFVGQPFALPGGRLVIAKLIVLPSVPVGQKPADGDTLQLIVETRASPEAQFEEVAASPVLSQYVDGVAEVTMPTPPEPIPAGERPAVARVRLIHAGAMQPRYEIRLIGL